MENVFLHPKTELYRNSYADLLNLPPAGECQGLLEKR